MGANVVGDWPMLQLPSTANDNGGENGARARAVYS
jgi:hypothetical protein